MKQSGITLKLSLVSMAEGCLPRNYTHNRGSSVCRTKPQKEQSIINIMKELHHHLFNISDNEVCQPEAALAIAVHCRTEQNPGPYICPSCSRSCTHKHPAVQCSHCFSWFHLKCSTFNTLKQRKFNSKWKGPCCIPIHPPTPTPPPPPHNPPPPSQNNPRNGNMDFSLCQININGIQSKATDLMHLLTTENIHVAMVQETKMTDKSRDLTTLVYSLVRQDHDRDKVGGVAFLVKDNVTLHTNPTPSNIKNNSKISISNSFTTYGCCHPCYLSDLLTFPFMYYH